jgi:hypothetical protein
MTYEDLVEKCKELRRDAERAEVRYFLFLVACEREHSDVWKGGGCSTFEQFMRSNHLPEYDRYLAFRDGLDKRGVDAALQVGVPIMTKVGRLRDELGDTLIRRALDFVKVEGVAPKDETVDGWARALPKEDAPGARTANRAAEIDRLREENRILKAECKTLRKENEDLKAKLAKKAKIRPHESQPRA